MLVSAVSPLVIAALLLLVPPDLIGAAESWEHGTVRLMGIFLAFHGFATLSSIRISRAAVPDATIMRLYTASGLGAVAYLFTGHGFFLVMAFSLLVGMTLNRTMKRLDLVFERAQERVGWRVPLPEQRRR